MKINLNKSSNRTVVSIDGMLDTSSSSDFLQTVEDLMAKEKKDILVDCSQMIYVSSQGIRAILTLVKASMDNDISLSFNGIRPAVKEILDMSGISEAMKIEL